MRPKSIVNFERVVLFGILINIVNSYLSWGKALAMMQAQQQASGSPMRLGSGFLLTTEIVFVVIWLLLVWFISHKGSPVAKWIYVVLALLTLAGAAFSFGKLASYGTVSLVLAIVQHLLTLVSLWLIFQPDAKAWFSEGRTADPADTNPGF